MSEIDDRIAREIRGFVRVYPLPNEPEYWELREKDGVALTGYMCAEPFSPSTNITHAIETLENLPKGCGWFLYCGSERYWFCQIWRDTGTGRKQEEIGASRHEKTICDAICRALESPKILAAIQMTRKEKR